MSAGDPLVSVVVCTYNRADLLPDCLASLAGQTVGASAFEVILVDNNSRDETARIAREFCALHAHFRYVHEEKQGLSHARNRGWLEARGVYVAYMDDDAKAFPDWIERMIAFLGRHPGCAAFGGPYEQFSTVAIPAWFPPDYGSWSLPGEERPIRVGQEWINGTNMIYRRDLLKTLGGFAKDLGMSGSTIAYGEETHLLLRLAREGHQVWYAPDLRVRHLLASYKLSLAWMLRSSLGVGRSWGKTSGSRRSLASHLSSLLKAVFRGILRFSDPHPQPFKRRLYLSLEGICREWGGVEQFIKNRGQ